MADAPDLGSGGFTVQVQVLSPAPNKKNVSFERFSYLVCTVFPLVPDWDGRFALQNRKLTRTLLLRFVAVCRLLRAVFLFGLRRFSRSSRTRRTFCFAKPKNDAHSASPICGCMPSPSSGFLIWSAPFSCSSRIGTDVLLRKTEK